MPKYCDPKMIVTFTKNGDVVEFKNGETLTPARIQRVFISARRALRALQMKAVQEQRKKEVQEKKDADAKVEEQRLTEEEELEAKRLLDEEAKRLEDLSKSEDLTNEGQEKKDESTEA